MFYLICRQLSPRYHSIDDDESTLEKKPSSDRRSCVSLLISLFTIAVILVIFLFATHGSFNASASYPRITHCGDSAEESRKRGCNFDIMSFSWLPPLCFDEELTDEFAAMQEWIWYEDADATQVVAKADVLRGQADRLFVSYQYHRAHCTFMWKKLHRALGREGFVDSYIGNYNHTAHCEHMLLMTGAGPDDVNTEIVTKFPDCVSKKVAM